MGELKFYKFLLLSFVVHLLFAGISLYRSNSYISKQPIKTNIYIQTNSKKGAFLPKSEEQQLSASNSLKKILNSSINQLNLSKDDRLLQKVKDKLAVSNQPELKDLTLNQEILAEIKKSKKNTTQILASNEKNPAIDSASQNNEYKRLIGVIIQNNWKSSFSDKKLQVIIQAKILKSGILDNLKVVRKSRLPAFDLSALEAIKNSHPFPAIADKYQVKEFVFVFRFQGGRILGE